MRINLALGRTTQITEMIKVSIDSVKVYNFLREHNILYENQFGFRKNNSNHRNDKSEY